MIKIIVFFLLGSFIVFIINSVSGGTINNIGSITSSRIGKIIFTDGSKLSTLFNNLVNLGQLNKEIENLRNENTALVSSISQLETRNSIEAFLEDTRNLRSSFNVIGQANVFSGIFTNFRQNLLLNKGEIHGIIPGDSVVTEEGVLIGRVDQVYGNFSTILVVNELQFKTTARVLSSNTEGIIKGALDQGLLLDLITQSDAINAGDTIITSGNDVTPAGLILGKVKEVNLNETDFFKEVKISPGFDASYKGPVLLIRI